MVEETYEYGVDRSDLFLKPLKLTKLPKDVKTVDELIKDTQLNPTNGIFHSWVYSSSLTYRDEFDGHMAMVYMKIEDGKMKMYKAIDDKLPLDTFEMERIKFPCVD